MGALIKIFIAVISVLSYFLLSELFYVPNLPNLENTWWGKGNPENADTSIKPFHFHISQDVLSDLKSRLLNKRPFVPPLEGIQHQYGMNTKLLEEIVDFWVNNYNWTEREKYINQFPQFTTNIQGLNIHYIHVKPKIKNNVKVLPLLILHGWPSSVLEFYDVIPILTKLQPGRDFVFEVIAASLPGYAFSEGAVKPGLGAAQIAVIFKNFMKRIGFEKYYLQGGDWGGHTLQIMATLFPENVLGLHTNFCYINTPLSNLKLLIGSLYPRLIVDKEHEHLVYPLTKMLSNLLAQSGYMHIQATKPDTIGVSMSDSPVGLMSYMVEKFLVFTNPEWINLVDGGLTKKFTYTKLLDNVMIYWATNCMTTSMRLYAESINVAHTSLQIDKLPITIPSACVRFEHEVIYQPKSVLQEKFINLVHLTDYNNVGHFAALEEPEIFASDVHMAFEKIINSSVNPE